MPRLGATIESLRKSPLNCWCRSKQKSFIHETFFIAIDAMKELHQLKKFNSRLVKECMGN